MSVDGLVERFVKCLERNGWFTVQITKPCIFMQAIFPSQLVKNNGLDIDRFVKYMQSRPDYRLKLDEPLVLTRTIFVKNHSPRFVGRTRITQVQVENEQEYTELTFVNKNHWSIPSDQFLTSKEEAMAVIVGMWANEQVRLGKGKRVRTAETLIDS